MKKVKMSFGVIVILIIISAGRENKNISKTNFSYPLEWRVYADELQESGLSKESAEHIAKQQFNMGK